MWSTLALLTTATGQVPPFLLVALSFAIAFGITVIRWLKQGVAATRCASWPLKAWLLGVGGLFGYHFLYFLALRHAPAAQASLINYLWPLLIVLFSAMLPGQRLRWWHAAGAVCGLIGTSLLLGADGRSGFTVTYALGYGAALACALVWAAYSVLSRLFAHVPTEAVGAFCAVTAALAAACHLLFEQTIWPRDGQWLAVLAMGLGPVGLAFFAWDIGMKFGDIRTLGALGYFTPLLSTALLVIFDRVELSWPIAMAALLISGGAALAARDLLLSSIR